MAAGARQRRLDAQRRQARLVGATGFAAALVTPALLFHEAVATLAEQPQLELHYLAGWAPWALLAAGLLFLVPVAWSAGMNPESRWFPRARTAYAGWGVSLYVLGFLLAWQVVQIQSVSG